MIDINSISTNLLRGDDGIWYTNQQESVSFPEDGHDQCLAVEDGSFWFKHRNQCICSAASAYPPKGAIFDVGGGNGFVSQGLSEQNFDVVLVEPGQVGAHNAKARGVAQVVCGTLEAAGFKPKCLPAVGLFDVVEHIEDDVGFLSTARKYMIEGGRLYLTVPAFDWLWSTEDEQAGHFRRYTLKSITKCVTSSGFHVDFATYFFRPLTLPILLFRSIPSRLSSRRSVSISTAEKIHQPPGALQSIMHATLANEVGNIAAGKKMHVGASCLVTATVAL